MAFRPRDLASRMAGRRRAEDGFLRETFTLPREAARTKARDFLKRYPKEAYMSSVERWRELPRSRSRATRWSSRKIVGRGRLGDAVGREREPATVLKITVLVDRD